MYNGALADFTAHAAMFYVKPGIKDILGIGINWTKTFVSSKNTRTQKSYTCIIFKNDRGDIQS